MKVIVLCVSLFLLINAHIDFEINGIRYFVSTPLKRNWHQAMRFCYLNGMYLLDMETYDEYNKVVRYLIDHADSIPMQPYWTSGTSLGTLSEFYWAISGKTIEYNGFAPGQPDNPTGYEKCIELDPLNYFQWNDERCWRPNSFICRASRYSNINPTVPKDPLIIP